jgi:hypothetical protein
MHYEGSTPAGEFKDSKEDLIRPLPARGPLARMAGPPPRRAITGVIIMMMTVPDHDQYHDRDAGPGRARLTRPDLMTPSRVPTLSPGTQFRRPEPATRLTRVEQMR